MTNDKISLLRANKENKCSRCIIEAKRLHRTSSFHADTALWHFQTTGISIHPASTENTQYIADSRKKAVFTVKLPKGLIYRLRDLAKSKGKSLSLIVTEALETF